jgi:hypothetical protein
MCPAKGHASTMWFGDDLVTTQSQTELMLYATTSVMITNNA